MPTRHEFRYRLFMMYLDLDELPQLFDDYSLWSTSRPALARFVRTDYHGDPSLPLDESVRQTVHAQTGARPRGPIRVLTHLRYFGYVFNPVSFYYCFDEADRKVETILAEITNTPWKQRHAYVLPVEHSHQAQRSMQFGFDKAFHVSPFMPMDDRYDWRFTAPGDELRVHMRNVRGNEPAFDATLNLERQAISHRSMALTLLKFPAMSVSVITSIYWQALRLWLKRTPVFTHPPKQLISQSGKSS